ncbi:unnamed protein product, partial [Rotaria sp. Silwood1]
MKIAQKLAIYRDLAWRLIVRLYR